MNGETSPWMSILIAEVETLATRNSANLFAKSNEGVFLEVVVNNGAGTYAYTPKIVSVDNLSNTVTIWSGANITSSGTYTYWIGPSAASDGAVTTAAVAPLPRTFKVNLTVTTGGDTSNRADTQVVGYIVAGG